MGYVRPLLMFALACLCAGCPPRAPEYRTTYSYHPPEGDGGRVCVMQCEVNRSQCEEMGRMRQSACNDRADVSLAQCEERAEADYQGCLATQRRLPGAGTTCFRTACYRSGCAADTASCEGQYNRCFQVCGGTVDERRECVANCATAGSSGR